MSEQERLHLIEWIILLDDILPSHLQKISDEEIEKTYFLTITKVSGEMDGIC
ncbi:BH0509 family protein [Bacillus wiedmannii]|uniref:BH0509 family protein n=1 Tax=Bacillus wiedmannii TaxID=1890302 RepID=UPI0011558E8D|nr:BH0509 family protein [Bacillus wiedmannii]